MIEAVGANLKEVHEVPFGLSPLDGLSSEKNECGRLEAHPGKTSASGRGI